MNDIEMGSPRDGGDVELLRRAGLRVTSPRLATLDIVRHRDHPDVDTVVTAVRERLGSVSRQTIYDVLHALSEAKILRRVSPRGRGSRYEINLHDNHHHLICRRCGILVDVPCPAGYVPCILPPGNGNLQIEVAEVTYVGLCVTCSADEETRGEGESDQNKPTEERYNEGSSEVSSGDVRIGA